MNKILRVTLLILILSLSLCVKTLCYGAQVRFNTPTFQYLVHCTSEITMELGEENYYVVAQNINSEIFGKSDKEHNPSILFGENALTEDNILKYYVFNPSNSSKNNLAHKLTTKFKNSIKTRAP